MSKVTTEAEYLTKDQVGEMLTCSSRHIDRLAKDGRFPRPIKLGRLARWNRAEVLKHLADMGATASVAQHADH